MRWPLLLSLIVTCILNASAQTQYHVDRSQSSLSRPADEPVFYSPIHFTVDTTIDLHMHWVKIQRSIPRDWEANVATFDSLFAETADSGDFTLSTDTTEPNLLETVFMPHNRQGHCVVVIKVFPINTPAQETELTFEAYATAPTGISTAKPLEINAYSVGSNSFYLAAPTEVYPLRAELYDLAGRLVISRHLSQPQVIFTSAPAGVYLLQLRLSSGELWSRKMWME
jgi:hypothetical protein